MAKQKINFSIRPLEVFKPLTVSKEVKKVVGNICTIRLDKLLIYPLPQVKR